MRSVNGDSTLEAAICRQLGLLGLTVTRPQAEGETATVAIPTRRGRRSLAVLIDDPRRWTTEAGQPPVLLGANHVPAGVGKRLRHQGQAYIDSGGNAWMDLPGFHIDIQGRKPEVVSAAGADRPSRAFGIAGLRVVFVLLIAPRRAGAPLRTIAQAAGVSIGATQGAVADLVSQGFIGGKRGDRRLRDQERLRQRWIGGYLTTLRPRLRTEVVSAHKLDWWRGIRAKEWLNMDVQLGGEAVLEQFGVLRRGTSTTIYGDPPWAAVRRHAWLRPDAEGSVVLRERFWDPRCVDSPTQHVPPLLVVADLSDSGDPRLAEAAREYQELHDG